MTTGAMAEFQAHMGVAEGEEWEPLAGVDDTDALKAFLARFRSSRQARGATTMPGSPCRPDLHSTTAKFPPRPASARSSTTSPSGDSELADRIMTTSPDVTGTTSSAHG
jgi:pyruvate dehydrogenase E1 component